MEDPKRIWIVSGKKAIRGGSTIYAVKSTEKEAVGCLEALRRHLIDVDGVNPGDIHFASDGDQSWCLQVPDQAFKGSGQNPFMDTYSADWWAIDEPSAFGETTPFVAEVIEDFEVNFPLRSPKPLPETLKIGTKVMLKSGGPVMEVVESCIQDARQLKCRWGDKGKEQTAWFGQATVAELEVFPEAEG